METANLDQQQKFIRDRMTWLGYFLMALVNFIFCALGPLMPFVRAELHLSMTVAALHFSFWSAGSLVAGFYGDWMVRKLGRDRIVWLCAGMMCCCLAVMICIPLAYCTIAGTFFAGIAGSVNGICFNSLMSNRFGKERAIGISESNVVASLVACAAPLIVGTVAHAGMNWRTTLFLPIAIYALLFLLFNRESAEQYPTEKSASAGGRLPLAYWAYWCVIVLNVGCEWSLSLWSATFLEQAGGLARADAAEGVMAFLGAMLLGRMLGSKLTAYFSTRTLLPVAAGVALTGFLCFWLGRSPVVNLGGLFIAGLGISNFYPLTLAAALTVAADNSTTATARMSLGTGTSVLIVPLVLGFVADRYSIFAGYGIVAIMLFLCGVMVFIANHQAQLHEARRLAPAPAVHV